jgi:hypothetical protein
VLVLIGALCLAAALWVIHRQNRRLPYASLRDRLSRGSGLIEWRVVAVLGGLMLLDNVRTGVFLAPNLVLPDPALVVIGAVAQALLAVILIFQISFVISGLLIVVALLLAGLYFPAPVLLDYLFEFGFLAAALIAVGPQLSAVDRRIFRIFEVDRYRFESLPVPLIRIGVGLTLVVLAIHNKLLSPALVLAFLAEHDFNFMPKLGFTGFSNLHFALAAGVMELVLGVLLLAGIATRAVVLILPRCLLRDDTGHPGAHGADRPPADLRHRRAPSRPRLRPYRGRAARGPFAGRHTCGRVDSLMGHTVARTALARRIALAIVLAPTPAHAHHVIGKPHYVTDGDNEPMLTLVETLGQWRVDLTHTPGKPDPDQTTELRFRITNVDSGRGLSRPVTVTARQVHAFGSAVTIHGPQALDGDDDVYEVTLTYPDEGNYLVSLSFPDGDNDSRLAFPVVVGTPGRPWVSLSAFVIAMVVFVLTIRAIKLKRDRRESLTE